MCGFWKGGPAVFSVNLVMGLIGGLAKFSFRALRLPAERRDGHMITRSNVTSVKTDWHTRPSGVSLHCHGNHKHHQTKTRPDKSDDDDNEGQTFCFLLLPHISVAVSMLLNCNKHAHVSTLVKADCFDLILDRLRPQMR